MKCTAAAATKPVTAAESASASNAVTSTTYCNVALQICQAGMYYDQKRKKKNLRFSAIRTGAS